MTDIPAWLSQEADLMVRTLWSEGHSATQIGLRMGVTKNQVIGKVHRLGLVRDGPLLPRVIRAPAAPRARSPHLPRAVVNRPPVAPPTLRALPPPLSHWRTCRWPRDDREMRQIVFECIEAPADGRPYCAAHCAVAYGPGAARAA
jgi:GcrA cell cycle regulator